MSSSSRSRSYSRGGSKSISRSSPSKERNSNSQSRGRSEPQQDQDNNQKKVFDFLIYLDKQQIEELYNKTNDCFDEICQDSGCEIIKYDKNMEIPDKKGKLLQIADQNLDKKTNALSMILNKIQEPNNRNNEVDLMILVPENMVSFVIGKQGKQVNEFKQDTSTNIVVNQPILGMPDRTVTISGHLNQVSHAARLIYDLIQERSGIVQEADKFPDEKGMDKNEAEARIIVYKDFIDYLYNLKSRKIRNNIMDHIDKNLNVKSQVYLDNRNPEVSYKEQVLYIKGHFKSVEKAIVIYLSKMNDYFEELRHKHDYKVKILIPSKYTTKIIGKDGSMIKDIAQKSGGANIKIKSQKGDNMRQIKFVCIEIQGNLSWKQDACRLITESVELFKNGGPILKTAKSMTENSVQQVKNAVQEIKLRDDPSLKSLIYEVQNEFRGGGRRVSISPGGYHKHGSSSGRRGGHDRGGNSGGGGNHHHQRSRSRTPPINFRDKYDVRTGQIKDEYKGQSKRDQYKDSRGGKYNEYDKYGGRDRENDRQRDRGGDRDRDRYRKSSRDYEHDSSSRNKRYSSKDRKNDDYQQLSIPVITSKNLVQKLQSQDGKLQKYIKEKTGCKVEIEKDKKLILKGTIDQNTSAFKFIQQELINIDQE